MKRELTCIICPMGCDITVKFEANRIANISGNTCPRGAEYAKNECTNPQRMLTTTILCENGEMLPVKTDRPIDKNKIFACMHVINQNTAHLPICIGDVIIENILETGSNIVSTKNVQGG